METIKLKVCGYEDASNSLIISFGCGTDSPEKLDIYEKLAYQPTMWPDASTVEPTEIIKRIAVSGVSLVEQRKIKETFVENKNQIDAFKGLIGQTFEFSVQELYTPMVQESADE